MKRLSALLAMTILTAGCSEESLRKLADKDDLAMSEKFIRDIQTGNDAGALKAALPELQKELAAELSGLRSELAKDPKAKLTLIGTSFNKSTELGKKPVDVVTLDYNLVDGTESDEIKIELAKTKGSRAVSMIVVNPPEEEDKDL